MVALGRKSIAGNLSGYEVALWISCLAEAEAVNDGGAIMPLGMRLNRVLIVGLVSAPEPRTSVPHLGDLGLQPIFLFSISYIFSLISWAIIPQYLPFISCFLYSFIVLYLPSLISLKYKHLGWHIQSPNDDILMH